MSTVKRTDIEIDERLIEEGLKATGLGSTNALVEYALRELVRCGKQKRLLRLRGTVAWEGDIQAMRSGRKA
jgi:Arc/MetJ family transcription regulator